MHPDEAVGLAIQDLRALEAARVASPRPAWPLAALAAALWRRYVEGWTWYVREGRTPPAVAEVGHLARRSGTVRAPLPRISIAAARDCAPLAVARTARC